MNNYEPVIGLEVHVELNTNSKMFCKCSADYFGKEPNTHTCSVCLGLPGALPYINNKAIDYCLKIGLVLNCQIAQKSLFERKNYFYPDLPKGYQISQYRWPLCINGWIEVEGKEGIKRIRINRVHQEEDTGKMTHSNNETLVDFNRSGVPLVEIVTEPDFTDVAEIRDYAKKLQQCFRYLGVSNADMERGDMRLEANVSIRVKGEKLPNYRVELKNINSFRFMVSAVEYEIKRQIKEIEAGRIINQETRGWNEDKKCSYLQRSKEKAHDYRYFPEPDLPELIIDRNRIEGIKKSLPELPWEKGRRFEQAGVKKADARILSEDKGLAEFFENTLKHGQKYQVINAQDIANYIINKKVDINLILPTQIIEEIRDKKVGVITDLGNLQKMAKKALIENPESVNDYKKGKVAAMQVLIGAVMRLSGGKADAEKTKEILKKLL
ncbi:Asp-tRNA(Asn)/Glu-tRNA(Gln) amidotransferase subunit GatB [Candidatus Daviesbacteria bacterium]|nr:Asp-tRNA(Asn)/Glu-tRNA(Gln) amidotransferase subunit GatB [Candidatus Daviesbacteria bacterium]